MSDKRKILITGACGYVGSQLLQSCAYFGKGAEIRILDNFSSGTYQALMNLPQDCSYELIEGDILNPAVVDYALNDVDIVIHLAAIVKTPMSFGDSTTLEQVNHWGTQNLLEAALTKKVNHFIHLSSTAVYGPTVAGKETHEFRPFGAYAHSKYNAEQTIQTYVERGLPVTMLRLGTVYGVAPVMRFDAVANRFVQLAATKKMLTIFGSGEQKRPLINVQDAIGSIFYCLENSDKTIGKSFNVIEDNFSIKTISEYITEHQQDTRLIYTDQDIRNHYSFEIIDNYLQALGWEPKHRLKESIFKQLDLYKGFKAVKVKSF